MNEKEDSTICPNCGEKLKSGWSVNSLIPLTQTNFINEFLDKTSKGYCDKCSPTLKEDAAQKFDLEKNSLTTFFRNNISAIPILTTHTPFGWEYEPISIVTGQSVTGTGLFSEIASSATDFFGAQSGIFNSKLAAGEKLCFSQLRWKALELNAEAIIATDIDYGEVGAIKGMLMVCCAGTAIKLNNKTVLGENYKIIEELLNKKDRLVKLGSTENPFYSEMFGTRKQL